MTTLSRSLSDFADDLNVFSAEGAVLQPAAIDAIVDFMRQAANNAASLERMLERRLNTASLPAAAPAPRVEPQNIVPFPARATTPAALRGGNDAA